MVVWKMVFLFILGSIFSGSMLVCPGVAPHGLHQVMYQPGLEVTSKSFLGFVPFLVGTWNKCTKQVGSFSHFPT